MTFHLDELWGESGKVSIVNVTASGFSGRTTQEFTSGDYHMKRRRWTAQEIQMLQERYAEEGPILLALEMDRSEDSVSSFAHRCGLRTTRWLERQEVSTSASEATGTFAVPTRCPDH